MECIIKKLEQIAIENCGIETFETRNSDSLDFYDISIGCLKRALIDAYELGLNNKKEGK